MEFKLRDAWMSEHPGKCQWHNPFGWLEQIPRVECRRVCTHFGQSTDGRTEERENIDRAQKVNQLVYFFESFDRNNDDCWYFGGINWWHWSLRMKNWQRSDDRKWNHKTIFCHLFVSSFAELLQFFFSGHSIIQRDRLKIYTIENSLT